MIKFKKLTIALLALLSVSTTAWADGVTASEIDATVSAGWGSDESLIKASDLPGYNKITLEQAMTWASAPASGTVYLIYEIVADGELKIAEFKHGNYTDSFGWSEEKHNLICEDINYGDKRYFYTTGPAASGPEVTIDNTLEQPEATFTMPQYDVNVTYALKRDMAVDMAVSVADAQNNSRFRVQKQGNVFVPVGLNMQQVLALFNVHDNIENTDLTLQQDYYGLIYSLDDNDQPTGDGVLLNNFNFAPGRYAVRAIGQAGSNYVGTTELSNVFTLFQGYELTIAAGDYATYYKDEALYVEDTDAQLYTITEVGTETATAQELTVAAANTPLLVKNNGEEEKTFLLIPTTDEATGVTPAAEFRGTLTALTVSADDMALSDYYACDGRSFVWVKDAGTIAANRAWLQLDKRQPQLARRIVFGNVTGVSAIEGAQPADGDWYDLNGRKLATKPTRKGVFIHNGKKVVIK